MNNIYLMLLLLAVSCKSDNDFTLFNQFSSGNKDLSSEELSVEDYMEWVEDEANDLRITREIGSYIFTLQYKPSYYSALIESRKNIENKDEYLKVKDKLSEYTYFTLAIQVKDNNLSPLKYLSGSGVNYNEILNYFDFQMNNDIKLIHGADTIDCSVYLFERDYEIRPYNTFLLGFEICEICVENNIALILYDKVLNTGPVIFKIKPESIKRCPKLKL